jgi:hypothetical protein
MSHVVFKIYYGSWCFYMNTFDGATNEGVER